MAFKLVGTAADQATDEEALEASLRERHLAKGPDEVVGTVEGMVEVRHEMDGGWTYGFRIARDGHPSTRVALTLQPWQSAQHEAIAAIPRVWNWDGPEGVRVRLRCRTEQWRGRLMLQAVAVEVLPRG